MNKLISRLVMAAVALAVVCLVSGGALANDRERPFRGRGEGAVVGACELDGISGAQVKGWIIATHLGLSEDFHCAIGTGGEYPICDLYVEGTVTAANGDTVGYAITGTIDVSKGPCEGEGEVVVLGGTGRFENAAGRIHASFLEPKADGVNCGPTQSSAMSGRITY